MAEARLSRGCWVKRHTTRDRATDLGVCGVSRTVYGGPTRHRAGVMAAASVRLPGQGALHVAPTGQEGSHWHGNAAMAVRGREGGVGDAKASSAQDTGQRFTGEARRVQFRDELH